MLAAPRQSTLPAARGERPASLRSGGGHTEPRIQRAFTLIELLVTLTVIGILIAVLLPALAGARESGRNAVCLGNLRQMFIACRAYADDYKGIGPAIGQPYGRIPNWALVVQAAGGRDGSTASELYSTRSVLVCPSVDAAYPEAMQRTYAMNATGHAGLPGDAGNYDDPAATPPVAAINFDRVERPAEAPLLLDSSAGPPPATPDPSLPPPTRTASVLDFRNASHVRDRLGRFHGQSAGSPGRFNVGFLDGSARPHNAVQPAWVLPLP